jgi:two-component system cell cycle response regulator
MAGRILVVDDVATNRIVMKVKLSAARYDVVAAASGAEAVAIARRGGIDAIIMDMMMPDMTGAETCALLRADAATAAIPVVLVTAGDDAAARMEGLSAGADDFLAKPVDDIALLARVRSLLRSREDERDFEARSGALMGVSPQGFSEPAGQARLDPPAPPAVGRIALISGGDTAWLVEQRDRLRPLFGGEVTILTRDAALALAPDAAPDLFVIEADMGPQNAGLRLMSELRSRQATRHAASVVVLPAGDSERAATALDLGAGDVVYRPLDVAEIAMRIRTQLSRKKRADRMRDTLEAGLKMAVIDPLTGLHNRRYGLHHLDRIAVRCRAQGLRAGVIVFDVDHFKTVNDTHGHLAGDRVLSKVAQILQERLRGEDMVFRIGGEEFLAVLPATSREQVSRVAERLRDAVERTDFLLDDGTRVPVTISAGIGMLTEHDDAPRRALAVADRALYEAKEAGRNRVVLAPGD